MRFIIGFIFFGLLFYAISIYFPETFHTLVEWAGNIFSYIKHLFEQLTSKASSKIEPPPKEAITNLFNR